MTVGKAGNIILSLSLLYVYILYTGRPAESGDLLANGE